MALPFVTIGVVGCNRLHYMRALLDSAQECIQYENLEWIVFDNASVEDGMREYLTGLDFVDQLVLREERSPATEHVTAMNEIVEMAKGEYLILMPDDMQFIVKGRWLEDLVELAGGNERVGSIVLNAQRHVTLEKFFGQSMLEKVLKGVRHEQYVTGSGRHFIGYGKTKAGINPAGIGTLTRTDIWRKLGPWKTTGEQTQGDSTGGGEDGMLITYLNSGMNLDRILPVVPLSASIYAGPNNDQAYVRANRRFATYMAPSGGSYYYRIWTADEAAKFEEMNPVASFEEVVDPIGFEHQMLDEHNLLPWQKGEDDPSEWIHPSVEGVEIA